MSKQLNSKQKGKIQILLNQQIPIGSVLRSIVYHPSTVLDYWIVAQLIKEYYPELEKEIDEILNNDL